MPDSERARRGAQRRDLAAAALVVAAIVGFVALRSLYQMVAPRPSQGQCAELLDRYLDHASRARDPRIDRDDIAQATLRAKSEPTRDADLRACLKGLSAAQVECGLSSPNVDEMERCFQ
jgi:hypothetical protein